MSCAGRLRFLFSVALAASACGDSRPVGLDAGDAAAPEAGAAAAPEAADAGALPATRSAGCDKAPTQTLGKYVKYEEVVSGVPEAYAATYTNRVYYVRLPRTYDPARAYPTVFLGPGCGDSGETPIPVERASGEDAILVGLNGVNNCFNKETADSPELAYFDETVKNVEAGFCVDPTHVFVAGFSSGSWLTSYLGCTRTSVIRAQASVAGGLPPIPATCGGPIPAMYVADTDDNKNTPATVQLAVERVRVANGCGTETEPYDFGVPSPCVQYKGCKAGYPLVSCVTSGVGHADQSSTKISTLGFWHFWTSLP